MLRLKLSPERARGTGASASPSPLRGLALFTLLMVGVGLAAGWMLARRDGAASLEPQTGPVLLAMQKIGDLHTVSYAMKDVLRQESQVEPAGWAQSVPGATGLVHWATRNRALVVAEGRVEAGVDLAQLSEKDVTKIRKPDGKTALRVHLPPVRLYPPNVRVHVENVQPGVFWRDENIAPKAQEQAGRRFLEAAERQNIRCTAQQNAIQMLEQMTQTLGHSQGDIEFTF
jgi:hypothetical protein